MGTESRHRLIIALVAALPCAGPAAAQKRAADGADGRMARPADRLEFLVARADGSIRVDGRMDDAGWRGAARIPLGYETSPGDNVPAPVATECLVTYDDDRFYFGCHATDPEPARIRAYFTDRDDILDQDRVGLAIDPFNDARRAFEFSVSALGVQRDARYSQQQDWDASWDAIWQSAGRVTDDGYVVEAAVPFKSLRFPAGGEVQTWGVYAFREWPRSELHETRSMYWDRGDACRLCQANLLTGIAGVSPGGNVELTPTVTGGRTERREGDRGGFVSGGLEHEVGVSGRWGVTPNLTVHATVNPDFSQIEADVAQLDVNRRFALQYPERRTFFVEGSDIFSTPLQAVFTRTIADPVFGAKFTGKIGSNAIGGIVARDELTTLLFPGNQESSGGFLDQGATTMIARFRRDVGTAETVGALYAGREGNGYFNRVGGVDALVRPLRALTVRAQLLASRTKYPDSTAAAAGQPDGVLGGLAIRVLTEYGTRDWDGSLELRNFGRDFRADAGFMPQVDLRAVNFNLERTFWSREESWYTSFNVAGGVWHEESLAGRLNTQGAWLSAGYNGPLQTNLWVSPTLIREYFGGVAYVLPTWWGGVRVRPGGEVGFGVSGVIGRGIDYVNGREGARLDLKPELNVRVGRHLDVRLTHDLQRLSTGGRQIFMENVSQLRLVYNVTQRVFLRAILQYRDTDRNPALHLEPVERERKAAFSQFLFSYKVNPQTVLFLGYSDNRSGLTDADRLRTPLLKTDWTVYLKIGYAWRP